MIFVHELVISIYLLKYTVRQVYHLLFVNQEWANKYHDFVCIPHLTLLQVHLSHYPRNLEFQNGHQTLLNY